MNRLTLGMCASGHAKSIVALLGNANTRADPKQNKNDM
jgi:hypothetical protein